MTTDLQRARSSLQALRATHVAELKKRDKEIEAMRERWSKLSDSQLKIGTLPSGMTVVQPANARVLALDESTSTAERGKGLVERALEEAESACAHLREENADLKGLVVDSANAVRRILHKVVTADPDDLEFVRGLFVFISFLYLNPAAPWAQPPPLAMNDLFPLGSPDTAFERLSKLLTALQDALTTMKASATLMPSGPYSKPQISLADLEKKVAESDAKAHKWEIEELQDTIARLRDELSEPCFQSRKNVIIDLFRTQRKLGLRSSPHLRVKCEAPNSLRCRMTLPHTFLRLMRWRASQLSHLTMTWYKTAPSRNR